MLNFAHPYVKMSLLKLVTTMRRRSFFGFLGGVAVCSLAARAEQTNGARRVGLLMSSVKATKTDRPASNILWTASNHWAGSRASTLTLRFGGLQCDVIVTTSTPVTAAVQRETAVTAIVFTNVSDPVGEGFVSSLASPGGNITGFINYEGLIAGKWLELLKEIDPRVTRAAIVFNPETAPRGGSYFGPPFEVAAKSLAITPSKIPVRSDADIDVVVAAIGREPGGGVVMASDASWELPRKVYRVRKQPVIEYQQSIPLLWVVCSLTGPISQFYRPVGPYVDQILKGTKPKELPVRCRQRLNW